MVRTKIETKNTKLETRPPIVVVMGHIDHGKTKILDWYRKTKVVEEESGGITQHIGAYEITHKGKQITFIDTPGHEAFSKMRSRGARVADIAVLVIAADEGMKPQTKETIEIIRENNLPFVVAINKIDKPEANTERVKQQLAEENVLVESYGGKVPAVEISAKAGVNMDALLEMLLLVAELENLQANPQKPAEGVVVEAHRDPQRGTTATLLIRDGTLVRGNAVVIGRSVDTIKILEDFRGQAIKEAEPSSPVLIAGLGHMPAVGDAFRAFESKKEADEFMASLPEMAAEKKIVSAATDGEQLVFNVILKADVGGSQEALEESLQNLKNEAVDINIIKSGLGAINESDVKMAQATKLVTIVGFKVATDPAAQELAENSNIRIVVGEIIYDVLDRVREKMMEMIPPEIRRTELGRIKILKIFSAKGGSASGGKKDGNRQIIGGRVEEGVIKTGAKGDIKRAKETIGSGDIVELQREKVKTAEVSKGMECGIMFDSGTAVQVGDILEVYEEELTKRIPQ
ncbi:MAG: translation initiation factor IF-2 [Candidatus Sungbacteria bacterium]|nr:translation initiation factor IF-2 [Candidatus Sungbacteria bacterium]